MRHKDHQSKEASASIPFELKYKRCNIEICAKSPSDRHHRNCNEKPEMDYLAGSRGMNEICLYAFAVMLAKNPK